MGHSTLTTETRDVKMLSAKMFQSPRHTLVLNVNELQVLWVSDHRDTSMKMPTSS